MRAKQSFTVKQEWLDEIEALKLRGIKNISAFQDPVQDYVSKRWSTLYEISYDVPDVVYAPARPLSAEQPQGGGTDALQPTSDGAAVSATGHD